MADPDLLIDLLPPIKGMYRLLEIVFDRVSGADGKIIVSQASFAELVETLDPGAYHSFAKIDFSSLDQFTLQPIGLCGSLSALVDFMEEQGAVDTEVKKLLLASPTKGGKPQASLRTGLYFLLNSSNPNPKQLGGYVIYWPESGTWDDDAISTVKRHRVMFMRYDLLFSAERWLSLGSRYLTQATEQIMCLMSKEHSDSIIWDDDDDERPSHTQPAADELRHGSEVAEAGGPVEHFTLHESFKTTVPQLSNFGVTPETAHLAPKVIEGGTRLGVIAGAVVSGGVVEHTSHHNMTQGAFEEKLREEKPVLQLKDGLSVDDVNHLLSLGLETRHRKISSAWKRDLTDLQRMKDQELVKKRTSARRTLDDVSPHLKASIREQIAERVIKMYPFIVDSLPTELDTRRKSQELVEEAESLSNHAYNRGAFHDITDPKYKNIRQRFVVACEALEGYKLPLEEQPKLDNSILTGLGFTTFMETLLIGRPSSGDIDDFDPSLSMVGAFANTDIANQRIQALLRDATHVSDPHVLTTILKVMTSAAPRSSREILRLATNWLLERLETQLEAISREIRKSKLKGLVRGEIIAKLVHMYPLPDSNIGYGGGAERDNHGNVLLIHLSDEDFSRAAFHGSQLTDEEQQKLDDAILTGVNYVTLIRAYQPLLVLADTATIKTTAPPSPFSGSMKPSENEVQLRGLLERAAGIEDAAVLNLLATRGSSVFPRSSREVLRLTTNWLLHEMEMLTDVCLKEAINSQLKAQEPIFCASVEHMLGPLVATRLQQMKKAINMAELENNPHYPIWRIDCILGSKPASYAVEQISHHREPDHVKHTIYLIALTANDTEAVATNPEHILNPVVCPISNRSFNLPLRAFLRHVQLLEDCQCVILVEDQDSETITLYLGKDDDLGRAISSQNFKKRWDLTTFGEGYLFAFNESKQLFALYSTLHNRLYPFAIDDHFTIRPRPEIDLRPWLSVREEYENVLTITPLSGPKPISDKGVVVTIDHLPSSHAKSNQWLSHVAAKIISITLRLALAMAPGFGLPNSLRLPFVPNATYSALDGSCLVFLCTNEETNIMDIRVYPSHPFGTEQEPSLSASLALSGGVIASFLPGSNVYLVAWSLSQNQLTGMRFKADVSLQQVLAPRPTQSSDIPCDASHNSIVDVHSNIWTMFPVTSILTRTSPAVQSAPPLLKFMTSSPERLVLRYFAKMIRMFENATLKPTKGRLHALKILKINNALPPNERYRCYVTTYLAGKWLIDLLALVPIQIAIVSGNCFIPLRDGLASEELEYQPESSDIVKITNNITLGWYESIFSFYGATKAVKVVTSMGEQSTGKSYTLNHFCNTSFTSSAMRCTEGVWLSLTPTENALVVVLDFECINSLERSVMEDTKLVLLNVALSHLVIFRNNFALSRDLSDLNPTLFRSILCIVIRDVTDIDRDEVCNEFLSKFQRFVIDEQEGAFITKIHRGKLNILPWPIIRSQEFYDLLDLLRDRLDQQEPSHGNALMFLQTLKGLMAMLKAHEWGPLDGEYCFIPANHPSINKDITDKETLAACRAKKLRDMLMNALMYGATEIESTDGHLKNFDTDEIISHEPGSSMFYLNLEGIGNPYTCRETLLKLREAWATATEHQGGSDANHISSLAEYLKQLAATRILHVRAWIDSNVARFSSDHTEICALWRDFEALSRELIAGVEICGAKRAWARFDEAHLCGAPCNLNDKPGCHSFCAKAAQHQDGEHICGANFHERGKPCHLSTAVIDGTPLCTLTCVVDCQKKHTKHYCETLFCPVKCQLCSHLCSAKDHGHALQSVVHLCGQEHRCEGLCAAPGICDVEYEPRLFTCMVPNSGGKQERLQFNKYFQITRRLSCMRPIPGHKLHHDEPHIHSLGRDVFHFCEARCPYCNYICSLPFGHAGEHSTAHGSMGQTAWSLDGDDDAVHEIQGRKLSNGESGVPLLCSMACGELGRHAHLSYCQSSNPESCTGNELEHIPHSVNPEPHRPKDWITHRLFWARSGFMDPYSMDDQSEFSKCDAKCLNEEHEASANSITKPSYCILPMLHPPARSVPRRGVYMSDNGHVFECHDPSL
ncbi:hypothetical protein DL93DRAFT_2160360 [Clavulina sp. PMI_390]|nr:hypothetical protein DL93DRAFT_2160360 [Clavulina sp. PMI_390]